LVEASTIAKLTWVEQTYFVSFLMPSRSRRTGSVLCGVFHVPLHTPSRSSAKGRRVVDRGKLTSSEHYLHELVSFDRDEESLHRELFSPNNLRSPYLIRWSETS
jgi:hypothetical protein